MDSIEHKIITLPANMPLDKRITEVGKQISDWMKTLDRQPPKSLKDEAGKVFLTKCEKKNSEYSYQYSIINPKNN